MLRNIIKILLFIMISVSYANALKKDSIKEEMTKKIDNVLVVLSKKELSTSEKGEEIIKIIDDVFDYELMARISLGKDTWGSLSKEKRKEFVKVFENKLKNSYIEKLDLYNDQEVEIISLKPYNKTRLQLETQLVGSDETYTINYNFYNKSKSNDEWFIYDIDLLGVSIIQTYRQQFSGLLKEKSFDEILTLLETSNKE